jgi:hypothetical protein
VFLILMLDRFHAFYTHGKGFQERVIDSKILALDALHGSAIALRFVLFLVQSLLIATSNRKTNMTLGWSAVAIGPIIACLGTLLAFRSVRLTQDITFFGMLYSRFLLVMFTEMASYLQLTINLGIVASHLAAWVLLLVCLLDQQCRVARYTPRPPEFAC